MLLRGPLSLVVLADVLALALSACGSGKAAETPPAVAGNDGGPTVTIQDLAYTPGHPHRRGRDHGHLGLARRDHRPRRQRRRLPLCLQRSSP
jgi:hypothetical protein